MILSATIMSSTVAKTTSISGRISQAPKKIGDSPIPKKKGRGKNTRAAQLLMKSDVLRRVSPKKDRRPKKKPTIQVVSDVAIGEDEKTTEENNVSIDAISGEFCGESNCSDRWNPSNPDDKDSTEGEAYIGGEDGGDDDSIGSEDEDDDTNDEDRIVLGRKCDPFLSNALETYGIEEFEVWFRLAKSFNSVSGIAKRGAGKGKILMKFIDDFNKRPSFYD